LVDAVKPDPIVQPLDLPPDLQALVDQEKMAESVFNAKIQVEKAKSSDKEVTQNVVDENQFAGTQVNEVNPNLKQLQVQQKEKESDEDLLKDKAREEKKIPVIVTLNADRLNSLETGIGFGTDTGVRLRTQYRRAIVNHLGHSFDANMELSEIRQSIDGRYNIPYKHPLNDYFSIVGGYERETRDGIGNDMDLVIESAVAGVDRIIKGSRREWQHIFGVRYRLDRVTQNGLINLDDIPDAFLVPGANQEQQSLLLGYDASKTTSDNRINPTRGFKQSYKVQLRLVFFKENEKLLEAQRIEQRTRYDLEMMQQLGYTNGIENYSRHLSGRPAGEAPPTLFDYIPDDALLIIDESHVTVPQIGAMYKGDRSRKENLVNYGFRLPSALDNRPMKFEEWERIVPATIYVSATPAKYELEKSEQVAEQVVRPTGLIDPEIEIRPVLTQVDDVLSEINIRKELDERVLVTTLTKRMAEDLTSYLKEYGVKVAYLHSDIDTVERVKIIHELRTGVHDVLVGINLLREGLDMPEVSLVAILDADKEGFLRSERSLIQTIGRAARHLKGKAILYADRITDSMQKAIDETDRRRAKQIKFNEEHGIIPRSAVRQVIKEIDTGERLDDDQINNENLTRNDTLSADEQYLLADPKLLSKHIAKLEKEMLKASKELQFEQAARLRDEIVRIKAKMLQ